MDIIKNKPVLNAEFPNCRFTSNKNYDIYSCNFPTDLTFRDKNKEFNYKLPSDISKLLKTPDTVDGKNVFNLFQSIDTSYADTLMMVGTKLFKFVGTKMSYIGDLEVLQKAYPAEDLNNIVNL
jgi:hypothetical protein